jgi:hypothetical protein
MRDVLGRVADWYKFDARGIRLRDQSTSAPGLVSRASPVQTAVRNCTGDEGRPFEVGNQVLISSHRKLLLSKQWW